MARLSYRELPKMIKIPYPGKIRMIVIHKITEDIVKINEDLSN